MAPRGEVVREFARRMKRVREVRGLSQEQLDAAIRVTRAHVWQLEARVSRHASPPSPP